MEVLKVTDTTFEAEVLRAELPVLVELYADWCAPCKQLAPLVEELAKELAGALKVVKVDVDRSPIVAQSFRAQSVPMLVVIANGQLAGHHVGLLDRRALRALVEPVLPRSASEVKPSELAQLILARKVVAVDVRDRGSYDRYRIPGAAHLAAAEVLARARDLVPTDGRVRVLYGRTADEAKALAEELQRKGIQVGFLAGGFLHWEADGFEVERGAP